MSKETRTFIYILIIDAVCIWALFTKIEQYENGKGFGFYYWFSTCLWIFTLIRNSWRLSKLIDL